MKSEGFSLSFQIIKQNHTSIAIFPTIIFTVALLFQIKHSPHQAVL